MISLIVNFYLISKSMQYVNSRPSYIRTLKFRRGISKIKNKDNIAVRQPISNEITVFMTTSDKSVDANTSSPVFLSSKRRVVTVKGKLEKRFELIFLALQTYKNLERNLLVPRRFVVPNDDDTWPIETWGMKLGGVVSKIRSNNAYADHRQRLESIEFDYTDQSSSYGYDVVEPALLTYKYLKKNMLVPASFEVPTDDDKWPIETWGMKLGGVVRGIRNKNTYADHRQRLESIGFDYSCQLEEHHSEMKCRKIFQEIYFPSTFDKAYPPWLISPITSRSLQLNGYNEDLKIAFEYRGKQHQTLSYYNDFDKNLLASLQVRDAFKESECALRGITLIIITSEYTYEDPIALKEFIISELNKYGILPLS